MTKDTSRIVAAVAVVIAAGALCGAFYQQKNNKPINTAQVGQSRATDAASTEFESSTPIDSSKLANLRKRYPAISREEAIALARADAGKFDPMNERGGAAGPSPDLSIDKTSRPTAAAAAKMNAGRRDPMGAIEESDWSRRHPQRASAPVERSAAIEVPPPPNNTVATSELPYPPARPSQRPHPQETKKPEFLPAPLHLKLSAIVGERAIVLVPLELQLQNGWPRSFCLAKGDSIEDVRERRIQVASISQDSVILEENGERFCKSLAPIR